MTYRQLQLALKELRNAGRTTIKLNAKKAVLQAEYARLTNMAKRQEAKLDRLFSDYRVDIQIDLAKTPMTPFYFFSVA